MPVVHVGVIGAGPAGLFAAEILSEAGHQVRLIDRMPTPGRKFVLAGRGGLNLTHSEELERFVDRYRSSTASSPLIATAVHAFPPDQLRAWANRLGFSTFVGTSGRVFPEVLRATPLLRAWLARLDTLGVVFVPNRRFVGFEGDDVVLSGPDGERREHFDAVIFALGGASWPRTGSDGSWVKAFRDSGVDVATLTASNCGWQVSWSPTMSEQFAGHPIKNVCVRSNGNSVRGELMIDRRGIEGGPIYALGSELRADHAAGRTVVLHVDLQPDRTPAALIDRLTRLPRGKSSTSNWLRKHGLRGAAAALLREDHRGAPDFSNPVEVAERIKDVELLLRAPFPIDRSISTAGGVELGEVRETFELRARPNCYVIGEMLDFDAPTGGYLLQACFATAWVAAKAIIERSAQEGRSVG